MCQSGYADVDLEEKVGLLSSAWNGGKLPWLPEMASRATPATVLADINQKVGNALTRVHKKLRPWHLYTALIILFSVIVAIVLAVVLVHARDQQKGDDSIQDQVDTSSNQSIARVNLGYAIYQGTVLENGVAQYLGLRYAKSPTGDLRWRAPVEPDQMTDDQAADNVGKFCLATGTRLPSASQDEDCLFANVWTPANATKDSKLPVWLLIQGGGYNANGPYWNGSQVVEVSGRNMILVNFNYRVGLYGFLASEYVRQDGDLNAGLLDQRFMMQWLQKHVKEFGGDPDHIVIQGISAGAGSVAHHLTSFGGKDEKLFHAAISESVFFPWQPHVSDLEWQFRYLVIETGCSNSNDTMSCLRGKSLAALQSSNWASAFPGRYGIPPLAYWAPCTDGDYIEDYTYSMYENGNFVDVPVIFGVANDEGTPFGYNAASFKEVAGFIQNNYPRLDEKHTNDILSAYPVGPPLPQHAEYFPLAARAYGEVTFICPNIHILNSIVARSNDSTTAKAWGYRYNVQSPQNMRAGVGVPHIWETWAVFGPDSINGIGGGPIDYYGVDAGMVPIVMNYWISFVRTLDPNVLRYNDTPEWLVWGEKTEQQQLRFETNKVGMETVAEDVKHRCELWKNVYPATEQ